MATPAQIRIRIAEIQKRLEEYHKHKNDPYVYYPEEIDAVRELRTHAPSDIEFLLALLRKLARLIKLPRNKESQ